MRLVIETPSLGLPLFSLVMVLFLADSLPAQTSAERLAKSRELLAERKWDEALAGLEPLLADADDQSAEATSARRLASAILHDRGEASFRQGDIAASLRDFDREVKLVPEWLPRHWQRGIALYYAERYDEGARQFESHQTVNPQDVENAVWHFLCVVRSPGGSVEEARKRFITITRDPRRPMKEVWEMFAGRRTPASVLESVHDDDGVARFYADLYVGLYEEAMGRPKESLELIRRASSNPTSGHYMGDVARVHQKLRDSKVKSEETQINE